MIKNAVLNEKGKVDHYICTECGCKYILRFQDTTLCPTCLKPLFHEIAEKLGTKIRYK